MSGPVSDGSKSVVPFGAKSKNVASSVADPLEAAGQTIMQVFAGPKPGKIVRRRAVRAA